MQVFGSLWLRGEQLSNTQAINKVCSPRISRLGYTYLRLKDNHMEILNKEDEIERLVLATELDLVQPWGGKKRLLLYSWWFK